ncbi:xylulokinase [Actinomycetospora lutea]|uniref:xylulokinase n=1 Tax=Actinomycetospora lutea TaxID=663604 RepID=UPI002365F7D3|nr:xylulokinase [Actinomycetospora lutea]MDD7940180.1 xylulokinase [Actinomycetospora lutea]
MARSATYVAGVDSSTQATKVLVVDPTDGSVVREARRAHPDGTEVAPRAWWDALAGALGEVGTDDVAAIGVAGQQHGMVLLDEDGQPVRDALLWNDTRSAPDARALIDELGGPDAWAEAVGTVPVASITATKLRWTSRAEPENAARARSVMLPHDWLTWRLAGAPAEPTTDRGDASGTGYWSTVTGEYRPDLLEMAFGRTLSVPRVASPGEVVGRTPDGLAVSAGTGDNAGAALAIGPGPGEVVISIGTSGAVFTGHDQPSTDASGLVAGFADARGGYLPLVCTLNAARVLGAGTSLLGVEPDGFDELARAASPGADGLVLLPYLDGERTPDRPDAQGRYVGLTTTNATRENLARATVEGMLCGLADAVDALVDQGVPVRRALLIGGGSRSGAVADLAPDILGLPVEVLSPQEYVALGAARQAAWALHGEEPTWTVARETTRDVTDSSVSGEVRARYADVRDGRAR